SRRHGAGAAPMHRRAHRGRLRAGNPRPSAGGRGARSAVSRLPDGPAVIREIGIVVPAHDEAARLPACLAAIHRATAHSNLPRTRVVVVADSCRDGTARVAERGGAYLLEVTKRSAGAARRAGFEGVLATST